ncbi:flagellar hook-length control protein FliK [Pleionea sp. CnH1-48]|uniref:flagellar hook-length control protein FliK n=1 Tax=Pleionea sp. CnH1-48 TaxID=2954494 RepID=UPI002097F166|nr:flagellar hook-length control protein FliK [Pleionea sp. CnH1-48]
MTDKTIPSLTPQKPSDSAPGGILQALRRFEGERLNGSVTLNAQPPELKLALPRLNALLKIPLTNAQLFNQLKSLSPALQLAVIPKLHNSAVSLQLVTAGTPNQALPKEQLQLLTRLIEQSHAQKYFQRVAPRSAPNSEALVATKTSATNPSSGTNTPANLSTNALTSQTSSLALKRQTLQQIARHDLPKQQSPTQLLSQLKQFQQNTSHVASNNLQLQLVRLFVDTMLNQTLSSNNLTSQTIKEAVTASGHWNESKLATLSQSATPVNTLKQDWKQNLLQIKTLLETSPDTFSRAEKLFSKPLTNAMSNLLANLPTKASPGTSMEPQQIKEILLQLNDKIEASLSRVRWVQSQNVVADNTPTTQWLTEFPFLHHQQVSLIQMMIEREPQNSDKKSAKKWSVTIRFEFENLGPIKAIVQLVNDRFSVRFIAEQPQTQQLFMDHINQLKEELKEAGVKVDSLDSQTGNASPLLTPSSGEHIIEFKV